MQGFLNAKHKAKDDYSEIEIITRGETRCDEP